jgi:hypothetical protein
MFVSLASSCNPVAARPLKFGGGGGARSILHDFCCLSHSHKSKFSDNIWQTTLIFQLVSATLRLLRVSGFSKLAVLEPLKACIQRPHKQYRQPIKCLALTNPSENACVCKEPKCSQPSSKKLDVESCLGPV